MLSHKEKLLRNFRTNHREKLLNARRTQINEAMAEQERLQFLGIFPTITGENYEEHRWKIAQWSQLPQYQFHMLVFAPLAYEYVLEHPLDGATIQILKNTTHYQEVDIPLSSDLVAWLMELSRSCVFDSLYITANLLSQPRNQATLRQKLLAADYVGKIDEADKGRQQLLLLSQIMSLLLSSQPILPLSTLDYLCSKLAQYSDQQEVRWYLSQSFTCIRKSFQPNSLISAIFVHHFSRLLSEKTQLMGGSLDLIFYCALSKKYIPSVQSLFMDGIKSRFQYCQETSLLCLIQYVEAEVLEDLDIDMLRIIWELLEQTQSIFLKQSSLKLFNSLSIRDVRMLVEEIGLIRIIECLIQCLNVATMRDEGARLLMDLMDIYGEEAKEIVEARGGKELLEGLSLQPENGETGLISDMILNQL